MSSRTAWLYLLLVSGAASLVYEVVWIRRLGLMLGGSAVAGAVVVGAFMGGLALGGLLSRRLPHRAPLRVYAALEAAAALWALAFPWLYAGLQAGSDLWPPLRWAAALALLLPPTTALGATWPVLARAVANRHAASLYAANTTGAVIGVLAATFVLLPALGVRGTEVSAAILGLAVAAAALQLHAADPGGAAPRPGRARPVVLLATGAAGLSAMGLEVVWMRLAAVGLGATVQTLGLVLATFLAAVAAGAWIGRRWPAEPLTGLGWSLGALGVLALAGALLWGQLPFVVSAVYTVAGADGLTAGAALVAMVGMGGAPVASGMAFSLAVRALGDGLESQAGSLYAVNTLAGVVGAWAGGLWAVPTLEIGGAVALFALIAAVAGSAVLWRPWPAMAAGALALVLPGWDARLYAVGVHLRISEFADTSPRRVRDFADEGWELLLYDHGTTGAVAVGRSDLTGTVWLSINGKVDASTGDDMPTQELSGILPVRMAARSERVAVVGLASGVTAGAVLAEPGVRELVVVELEPVVVRASHFFEHVNGRPLEDPRTTLVVDDARAWLRHTGTWDVIISEPSNPWITGVSNLFTLEYWQLTRAHLAEDGVMCQWLQLYGMGPRQFRALLRTFTAVYPESWFFETVEGSDVLLVGGAPSLPDDLPIAPTLDPEQLRGLAGRGWLNTDDRPRVEWEAPEYLHYETRRLNAEAIRAAARR